MKRMLLYILLLIFSNGFTQTGTAKKLSDSEAFELSKGYQNKAMWYQNMPQYNYRKSIYYYDKAISTLKQNESFFYEEIASIYLKRIDFLQINESYKTLDSIANQGWKYVELAKKNKTKVLEFQSNCKSKIFQPIMMYFIFFLILCKASSDSI